MRIITSGSQCTPPTVHNYILISHYLKTLTKILLFKRNPTEIIDTSSLLHTFLSPLLSVTWPPLEVLKI